MTALEKGQPLRFVIGSSTKPPGKGLFYISFGIQENPPHACHPFKTKAICYIQVTSELTEPYAKCYAPTLHNEAEWLALIQGLHLLHNMKIHRVLIFGDSRHVIYKMVNGYPTGAIKCRRLYGKAKLLMANSYEIYHILRQNNTAADSMANVGASLSQGLFSQNGAQPSFKPIP